MGALEAPDATPDAAPRAFLTAAWRDLLLLNWKVDTALLDPYVPPGTELDLIDGAPTISAVGFRFLDTRMQGVPIPGHQSFDEINLRTYVQRRDADGSCRRGVVFLHEVVARRAVTFIARRLFNEPYVTRPMFHRCEPQEASGADLRSIEYGWRGGRGDVSIAAAIDGPLETPPAEAHEASIAEHAWGFGRTRRGGTLAYHVNRPPWRVAPVRGARLTGDASGVWGPALRDATSAAPDSAFFAEGSPIAVSRSTRIT